MSLDWSEQLYTSFKVFATQKHHSFPSSPRAEDVGEWLSFRDNRGFFFNEFLKDREQKKYIYMITFTLSPDKIDKADEAEAYVRSQSERVKSLSLTSLVYCKEYTKKGVPHFHLVVEASKPLKRNRFTYYEKLYGRIDFSRTKGTTNQEALQYISKDSEPIILL